MSMVRYKQSQLPPPSASERARMRALARGAGGEIDLSDIPVLPDQAWASAERGRFYKPVKTHATVRIDADVMAWLKSQGRGYQTRLNGILRQAMLNALGRG
jgi:uncharacterized protein (DUF4415 family)